jgi:hypothetical protein
LRPLSELSVALDKHQEQEDEIKRRELAMEKEDMTDGTRKENFATQNNSFSKDISP